MSHSFSPRLHNAAFAAAGLDYAYVALPVPAGRVGDAVRGLAALGFRGANVTIPHKGAVIPYLSRLDEDAAACQAVNTIVVEDGELCGHNTDVEGVRQALAHCGGGGLHGAPAMLLGAGGAARAAGLTLARMGCEITIVNRTPEGAERLARLLGAARPGVHCDTLPLQKLLPEHVRRQRLVLNATSLGMEGAGKVPAVLVDNVGAGQIVFDLVYARDKTDLLAEAEAHGALVVSGVEMLIWQAAASFELWTGTPAPLDVMRDAVER